jgi:hypothetical protein
LTENGKCAAGQLPLAIILGGKPHRVCPAAAMKPATKAFRSLEQAAEIAKILASE